MPGQGSGKTMMSEAQGCRLFVIVEFRPADALFGPESGGDQGTLFVRNVVQGYGLCVIFCLFCAVFVLLCFFSSEHFLKQAGVYVLPPSIPGICRFVV